MDLWLHANIESHSFIEADYWKKNYDMVRKLIPEAKVFVAEENEEILGFIGLTDTYRSLRSFPDQYGHRCILSYH